MFHCQCLFYGHSSTHRFVLGLVWGGSGQHGSRCLGASGVGQAIDLVVSLVAASEACDICEWLLSACDNHCLICGKLRFGALVSLFSSKTPNDIIKVENL